ncbi:ABC transporter permease [Alteribacillus iranensis]|uniref:Bacitracin transport system permease protein n=1 Tax=Alteribacillus iranensis TaxID=930128 RepID=A0A1I2DT03_9BACI|nr:ABC transporter permease [Alteribacillus iranensis]SFE83675.1 bacitracin transport system permease protein [Alteribacillus iranensis]
MTINQLIMRNLKKNLQHYYLYVFALIFCSALYFAFVTLQFDPSMSEAKGSIKGEAAIRAASVVLLAIVTVFLLYANKMFIKRRSREIGLFQLIGMTKNKIIQILLVENLIIYFSSLLVGIFFGFAASKLLLMILMQVTGVEAVTSLQFSPPAFLQTVIAFTAIYLLILLANYIFIKKQSVLSLFRMLSTSEDSGKNISFIEMVAGILGILLIGAGYAVSSQLFNGDFTTMAELFVAMLFILVSVIVGTYLFYKGSVHWILHVYRKRKDGYLTVNEVLSLSSLMFRMKSNALLLTIITTISALAIGLLSLSYITYYSAEQSAKDNVPHHFALTNVQDAERFEERLRKENIPYYREVMEVIQFEADVERILEADMDGLNFNPNLMVLPVISDANISTVDLSPEETIFTGYNDMLQRFMTLSEKGSLTWEGATDSISQTYLGLEGDYVLSYYFTNGGLPTAIVDNKVFERMRADINEDIQKVSGVYVGIQVGEENVDQANAMFQDMNFNSKTPHHSQQEISENQKQNMGLAMFIVGFLGLTFLITSGCVLYFKQLDESEEEKSNYVILRKLGYTHGDLLTGVKYKQLFSFGIPLFIGLLHSYFAVQSGWFLFGTELWTPMVIVMIVYTLLYSVFGILSLRHYKKIIKSAL